MNRRVWLKDQRLDQRPIANAEGVAGESFETEVYAPYGLAVDRDGESILIEMQGRAQNYVALAPMGDRVAAPGTLVLYYNDTTITLANEKVSIVVNGGSFEMDGKNIVTDMTIRTTGDVVAGGVSLRRHKHTGVKPGPGITGRPIL